MNDTTPAAKSSDLFLAIDAAISGPRRLRNNALLAIHGKVLAMCDVDGMRGALLDKLTEGYETY